MLIKTEYDIQFHLNESTPMVALLHVHPFLEPQLRTQDNLKVEHIVPASEREGTMQLMVEDFLDGFGNRCSRFMAPAGAIRLSGTSIISASDEPDPQGFGLPPTLVQNLPYDTMSYLLASRYCEVDRFSNVAHDLFNRYAPGWETAAAIRDWVHEKVSFDYQRTSPNKTAMDVFIERVGVCRDFQHLAITLTRCMNIPARYATGYLGDIRVAYSGPGDFSAWYQIWLDGRWWDMDARHNEPRLGRVLMATGRDAADVAITTSFGQADLTHFYVDSHEIDSEGHRVGIPQKVLAGIPVS